MKTMSTFEKATLATTGMASAVALIAGSAQAQDFDGFYMGLGITTHGGDSPLGDEPSGDQYSLESTAAASLFVGYNTSVGNGMVVGAELAFNTNVPGDADEVSSYPDSYGMSMIDLKAKVGGVVSTGARPILLYGFAGLSTGGLTSPFYGDYNANGFNYGLGGAMKVSDNFSVGLEVMGRTLESYNGDEGLTNTNHYQVSLRGAFHF
jgi:maltoporin